MIQIFKKVLLMIMGNNDQSLVTRPGPELGKDQSIGIKASVTVWQEFRAKAKILFNWSGFEILDRQNSVRMTEIEKLKYQAE